MENVTTIKTITITDVPEGLVNTIQAAQTSCRSIQDMMAYMITKVDFNKDAFIAYHNESYIPAFVEYDAAKEVITKTLTPEEFKGLTNISWNMDFATRTIEFTADTSSTAKDPIMKQVDDIEPELCDNLKALQCQVTAMNDFFSYIIERRLPNTAIDTYAKLKEDYFLEYDAIKTKITNELVPEDFRNGFSTWDIDFNNYKITFTK